MRVDISNTMTDESKNNLNDFIAVVADQIRTNASNLAPIDTGNLRNSIHVQKSGEWDFDRAKENNVVFATNDTGDQDRYLVGTNVEYALAVEEGHKTKSGKFRAGHFYFQQAIQWVKDNLF